MQNRFPLEWALLLECTRSAISRGYFDVCSDARTHRNSATCLVVLCILKRRAISYYTRAYYISCNYGNKMEFCSLLNIPNEQTYLMLLNGIIGNIGFSLYLAYNEHIIILWSGFDLHKLEFFASSDEKGTEQGGNARGSSSISHGATLFIGHSCLNRQCRKWIVVVSIHTLHDEFVAISYFPYCDYWGSMSTCSEWNIYEAYAIILRWLYKGLDGKFSQCVENIILSSC